MYLLTIKYHHHQSIPFKKIIHWFPKKRLVLNNFPQPCLFTIEVWLQEINIWRHFHNITISSQINFNALTSTYLHISSGNNFHRIKFGNTNFLRFLILTPVAPFQPTYTLFSHPYKIKINKCSKPHNPATRRFSVSTAGRAANKYQSQRHRLF